jgi:ABC-2 type transport system permease protein
MPATTPLPPDRSSQMPPSLGHLLLAAGSLWQRDMRTFLRQRGRILGAFAPPVLFWLLLGSGLNQTIRISDSADGLGYMALFFPGTVAMIVVFTTIFTAYSVIEDRRAGFLQGVLASPAPRLAIALGKIGGGAGVAILQGLLMLAFWPMVGPWPGIAAMAAAAAMLAVIAVMMTCVGFALAWPMSSSAGFHAVLNLTIFPMWLMSGAVFPYGSAAGWQKIIMALNPLTYAQAAFATALHGGGGDWHGPLPAGWCAAVAVAATAALLWACARLVGRRRVSG